MNLKVVNIGSKVVLDVLSKAFHNNPIVPITDGLIQIYQASDESCINFMNDLCEKEDGFEYAKELFLNCPDRPARVNVGKLFTKICSRMVDIERDYLQETEKKTINGVE
jgi:hypothetical protein